MFRAFVIANRALHQIPSNGGGAYEMATLDDAKASTAVYIGNNANANTFGKGYDAYILDLSSHQIVSFASTPQPQLDWKDVAGVSAGAVAVKA